MPRKLINPDGLLAGKDFINPANTTINCPAIDHDIYRDVINSIRETTGINFIAAHIKVLHAEQSPVTKDMNLASGWQKYGNRRERKRGIFNNRTSFISIAHTVNFTAVQRIQAGNRLDIPGVKHPKRQSIPVIIALIHRPIEFAGAIAVAYTVKRTVNVDMVLTQRCCIVYRQIAASTAAVVIIVVVGTKVIIQDIGERLHTGRPKQTAACDNRFS